MWRSFITARTAVTAPSDCRAGRTDVVGGALAIQGIAFDDTPAYHQAKSNLEQLAQWCAQHKLPLHDTELCQPLLKSFTLAGPTGEQNLYELLPVQAVLCVAVHASDLVTQLAGVLAAGSRAIWDGSNPVAAGLHAELPDTLRKHVHLADDWLQADFDVAIHHGDSACLRRLLTSLAQREGILVPVIGMQPGEYPVPLERLVLERAISTNTAAAGGNTTLMSIA